MTDLTQEARSIRERIFPENPSLNIKRVPANSLKQFLKLSDEEFCSDYGMTLKALLDFYFGLIPTGIEHIELELDNIKNELNMLKLKVEEDKIEKKKKNMRLDGTGGKE